MVLPVLVIIIALVFLLAAFLLIRMLLFSRRSSNVYLAHQSSLPGLSVPPLEVAKNLSAVIKVETISHEDVAEDVTANFKVLQTKLAKQYPLTHSILKKEILDGYSLLYTWKGSNSELDPIVFMAHQDVVPADENTLAQWTYPPFSGEIADGFIWGRGTLDIKSQLIAVFEAVEQLIKNNFQPERTVMLSFSHNEEVLGSGAVAVVAHLKDKGIRLQAVMDEGGSIYDNMLPGVEGLAAMIGVGEKGYLSLKLQAHASGGHSSTPSQATAIGILSTAIDRLQKHKFPARVSAVLPMFEGLGAAASPIMQFAFANLWLFKGLIESRIAKKPEADATIRTTTAPTIIKSGLKDNVLPSVAEAVVNFRLLQGETIATACERVRKIIHDDRVTFEPMPDKAWEASSVSDVECPAYRHIASVTTELFPGTAVAPYIMLGATDSRNFHEISDQVYGFSPIRVTDEDNHRVHGVNERISIDAMHTMVEFFYRLIPRWATRDM